MTLPINDPGFLVLNPGIHTLVQDDGRTGYYRWGLTTGGPADRLSFDWANRLCGNSPGTIALEITLGGLSIQATGNTQIAVTGADLLLNINGQTVKTWRSHNILCGDIINFSHRNRGIRSYLAVKKGLQIPAVFSSAATVVRESLGGLNGGPLKKGDHLPFIPSAGMPEFALSDDKKPLFNSNTPFRVIPGFQARELPRHLKRLFFKQIYTISPHNNRMGYRLEGTPLPPIENNAAMLSEGITPGAIQIPPDGQPIVMLCDHQTIGGYPKIGTVISSDLWRLAQFSQGESIQFQAVTLNRAQALNRAVRRTYERACPHPVESQRL